MREVSHISSCLCAVLLLYACSTGTHVWSHEVKLMFQRLRQRLCIRGRFKDKTKPKATLINSDGHEIGGFDRENEKNIHFTQLEIQWGQ